MVIAAGSGAADIPGVTVAGPEGAGIRLSHRHQSWRGEGGLLESSPAVLGRRTPTRVIVAGPGGVNTPRVTAASLGGVGTPWAIPAGPGGAETRQVTTTNS